MAARSKARKRAVDVLYEADVRGGDRLELLRERVADGNPPISEHAVRLVEGVEEHSARIDARSEEHTSELQSRQYLVCRLLLEKKIKHIVLPSGGFDPHDPQPAELALPDPAVQLGVHAVLHDLLSVGLGISALSSV